MKGGADTAVTVNVTKRISKITAIVLLIALALASCVYLPGRDTGIADGSTSATAATTPIETTAESGSTSAIVATTPTETTAESGSTSATVATTPTESTAESGSTSATVATTPTESTAESGSTSATVATPPDVPIKELTYDPLQTDLKTASPYSFIADAEDMRVLFLQGGKDDKIYPASITKLVCALVALSFADEDEKFTVGSEMSLVARDASKAGLKKGDVLTVDQLLYALLLPSGGDAAYTLSVNIGRIIAKDTALSDPDASDVFVRAMNEYAKNIGMKNTLFESPDGYVEGEEGGTTTEDMILLGIYCAREKTLHKYTSCYEKVVELSSGRRLVLKNTNSFVNPASSYFMPSVFGLKTGNNDKAGKCLIACANINGRVYVVGSFRSGSSVSRLSDIKKLFDLLSSSVR